MQAESIAGARTLIILFLTNCSRFGVGCSSWIIVQLESAATVFEVLLILSNVALDSVIFGRQRPNKLMSYDNGEAHLNCQHYLQ